MVSTTGATIQKIEPIMCVKKLELAKWPGTEKDSSDHAVAIISRKLVNIRFRDR
jgi:hypothetical protein